MKNLEKDAISQEWTNGDRPMVVHTHVVFAEKMNRPWAILNRCHFDSGYVLTSILKFVLN